MVNATGFSIGVMVFIRYKPFFIALHLNLPLTGSFVHFYFLKKNLYDL